MEPKPYMEISVRCAKEDCPQVLRDKRRKEMFATIPQHDGKDIFKSLYMKNNSCVFDTLEFCYIYLDGYVVYRHIKDIHADLVEIAKVHKVATFITESEAKDYCEYRNKSMLESGTDLV